MREERLRITEIFHSLQGESRTAGIPTVLVRLTGCPLRCRYCDTTYAFSGGHWTSLSAVCDEIARYRTDYVTVTGGEPLAQPACRTLLTRLCDLGLTVSLETSGALSIAQVDQRVSIVMDLKTPASGEMERNLYSNIHHLSQKDQAKFVICDRSDYEWARARLDELRLTGHCEVLFSPGYGIMEPATLADWVLSDQLPVRLQIQLHKYLWGDMPGR